MQKKTQHTPGPWSRSWVYGALRHINKNVDESQFWAPGPGESSDVYEIQHPNVRSNPADADLVTAAPDLFAALEACVESLEAAHSHERGGGCACVLAKAALKKARGES